jgi:hypothetical protein
VSRLSGHWDKLKKQIHLSKKVVVMESSVLVVSAHVLAEKKAAQPVSLIFSLPQFENYSRFT